MYRKAAKDAKETETILAPVLWFLHTRGPLRWNMTIDG